MAKKNTNLIIEEEIQENIHSETMEEIMGSRYATYAKYVIQDRAIPDARDGLKPVQRRIIYYMYKNGNIFTRPTRKSAHTVGGVMGKYHPHGDTSIYEALVRMSQDWKVNAPLIDFQGNKGSIDGDPPAAYRYTEARLSLIAEEMIRDIEKDTVDMALTFDDDDFEPVVLPARFPNLLVNGSEGIAVALATDIPPHNLKEVIEATIYRINHVNVSSLDLMQFIPGPDFPTGGIIYKTPSLVDSYTKGRGRIEISSKTEVIDNDKEKRIVITEIPYGTIKIDLVHELDMLRHDKVLPGILEVRDESDQKGLRIVIDLKKDANMEAIYNYLNTKTGLRGSFSPNMVAIVNGSPKTMTLLDFIDAYIAHQVEVITRRSEFDLKKSKGRLEIVDGLIKAVSILDEVVNTIRASKDKQDAKKNISEKFGFSEPQAEAIVMLQLYKLTNTDMTTLINEKNTLIQTIAELEGILSDRKKLDRLLCSDLRKIAQKYGRERRSVIVDKEENTFNFDKRDLIVKEETMVAVTNDGYIKRSSVKSYRSSGDNPLPGLKEGDALIYSGKAMTTDFLICFTNQGNYLYIPVHEINENKWKDEGKHINYLASLNNNEKIVRAFVVETFRDDLFFILVSKFGQIKRLPLSLFPIVRHSKSVMCMKLLGDDEVKEVMFSRGNSNILLFLTNGFSSLFNENEIPQQGLKSGGVKAIGKLNGAFIATGLAYDVNETKGKIIILTDKGCLRIYEASNTALTRRLGRLTEVFKCFKSEKHTLIYAGKVLNKEEPTTLFFNTALKETKSIEVNDYHLTPMDKYAKAGSVKLSKGDSIEFVFVNGDDYISNDIVSNMIKDEFEEENEEDSDTNTPSLFEETAVEEKEAEENSENNPAEVDSLGQNVPNTEDVNEESLFDAKVKEIEERRRLEEEKALEEKNLNEKLEKMKEEEEKGYKQVSIFDDTDFD